MKTKKASSQEPDGSAGTSLDKWLPAGLLVVTLLAALWAMTRELDKPLLGPHAFRQTQTAMSTYYMAQDPLMFADYITPVLGKPWRIPMELPVYQWVVARWHNATGMPLDPSGKVVSMLAWFLCLVPMFFIFRRLGLEAGHSMLGCALLLACPLYLFWGAAFLMETTGLLFVLCSVAAALASAQKPRWGLLAACVLFGTVGGMVKATTWAVGAGTGMLLILALDGLPDGRGLLKRLPALVALCIPVIGTKLWLAYADTIKEANPFAREFLTSYSPHQGRWNYGTLDQKLDPAIWNSIAEHFSGQILMPIGFWGFSISMVLIAGGLWFSARLRLLILGCLAGFISGPIVFTNLYFEHSYYWCANGVWFIAGLTLSLAALEDRFKRVRWVRRGIPLLTVLLIVGGYFSWGRILLPVLERLPTQTQLAGLWSDYVQKLVPSNRTVLYLGPNWNPAAHYYAQRKGLAFPTSDRLPLPGPQFNASLSALSAEEAVGAVLVAENFLSPAHRAVLRKIFTDLHISEDGMRTPFGILFPALDLAKDKQ